MDSNYTITALLPTSNTEHQALVTTSNPISSNASFSSGEASDIFGVINIKSRVYIISIVTEYDSVKCIMYNLNDSSPLPCVGLGHLHGFSGGFVTVNISGVGSSA
jgi:hypothetical protein